VLKTHGLVAVTKNQHQRQQQHLDDELRDHHGHEAVRRKTVALIHVAGKHAAQRRIGQIVGDVDAHQQRVAGKRIRHLPVFAEVWRAEGEQCEHAERNRRPQQPRPELAPARVCAVRNQAHYRREHEGAEQTDRENHRGRRFGGNAIHVGVKEGEKAHQCLKDQVRSEVAEAVADLLHDGECLPIVVTHARR
jgi:hypothetical protein